MASMRAGPLACKPSFWLLLVATRQRQLYEHPAGALMISLCELLCLLHGLLSSGIPGSENGGQYRTCLCQAYVASVTKIPNPYCSSMASYCSPFTSQCCHLHYVHKRSTFSISKQYQCFSVIVLHISCTSKGQMV
jgi:hypothetical protein